MVGVTFGVILFVRFRTFFVHFLILVLLEEAIIHHDRQSLAVFIIDVGIHVSNHVGLRVACIALYGLNVTAEAQLHGNTGVSQTVEDHRLQIIFFDQVPQRTFNELGIYGIAVGLSEHQVEVGVLISNVLLPCLLAFFVLQDCLCNKAGDEDIPDAAFGLRSFQYQSGGGGSRFLRREDFVDIEVGFILAQSLFLWDAGRGIKQMN